jgi:hypothetical protein
VVDGIRAAATLVSMDLPVSNGVLDTIERVMDAITFVMNAAGMLLGATLGWLLKLLGFLFDWYAIKEQRDRLRDLMRLPAAL